MSVYHTSHGYNTEFTIARFHYIYTLYSIYVIKKAIIPKNFNTLPYNQKKTTQINRMF